MARPSLVIMDSALPFDKRPLPPPTRAPLAPWCASPPVQAAMNVSSASWVCNGADMYLQTVQRWGLW